MENKEHDRMILELVKHSPLIWPTIEEKDVIKTKKYGELSTTKKIQADCDVKATNIILQGTRANTSGLRGRTSGQQRVMKCFNCQKGSSHDASIVEGPVTQTVIINNAVYQANDLVAYNFDFDDTPLPKLLSWPILSRHGSNVLSEEKESLTTTFKVLKNESKEKEAKNIDLEIALEKKVKELNNIVYKMGQSAQTVHMLLKPQVFYDNNLKQALGFQFPFYLKKAQQIRPMLYDDTVIAKETNVISITHSEETLMREEESQSKILLKQNFNKQFVPQQELSAEQAFWFQMSNPSTESSKASPVKLDVPSELPKENTPPVTYPDEVKEIIGIPIELEPLDETPLEDLGLNTYNRDIPLSSWEIPSFDELEPQPHPFPSFPSLEVDLGEERGPKPPIKAPSPDSFRMKEVDHLINHTTTSPHVESFHPKDRY
uniref:Uncharacterized protein n=1 Tax=Tanacetum cinerariifolium TaxID=118510 RepID=A0A6L2K6H4_TANCI|nr:hypothetical protein [Tanacetum cinerariifolium]